MPEINPTTGIRTSSPITQTNNPDAILKLSVASSTTSSGTTNQFISSGPYVDPRTQTEKIRRQRIEGLTKILIFFYLKYKNEPVDPKDQRQADFNSAEPTLRKTLFNLLEVSENDIIPGIIGASKTPPPPLLSEDSNATRQQREEAVNKFFDRVTSGDFIKSDFNSDHYVNIGDIAWAWYYPVSIVPADKEEDDIFA